MSETVKISPLLDEFTLGNMISSHHGAQCYPAIRKNSDCKYIVKVVSVPPSQNQLDAMLLAGAYKDPADAMEYFRQQAERMMQEAEILKQLSALDGFLSYERCQIVPITRRRLGYNVCLVGSYKKSLEKYVRKNPVTHLEAMNLGLDLCAALTSCRQAGWLYVDLKPSNIFLSDQKKFRIGDLGFIRLDAMRYGVIPDQYRSVYTPPELHDPMASLNMTVDTYAVGMILYQLYNDGQLPFREKAPQEVLPSPLNADYELAEILMRAIHPDPFQRWDDPAALGQALREYMQRNSVNNDPITVHTPLEIRELSETEKPKSVQSPSPEPEVSAAQEAPVAEHADTGEGDKAELPQTEPSIPEAAELPEDVKPEQESVLPEEHPADAQSHTPDDVEDETLPTEEDALLPHEMSDELSRIVAKADDLISHETPAGVVLPEVPEIPDPFAFAADVLPEDEFVPIDPMEEEPEADSQSPSKKKENRFISREAVRRKKRIRTAIVSTAALALLGTGAFFYYQNIYLQDIRGLSLQTGKDHVSVAIDSDISDRILKVHCTDSSGKVLTQSVTDGTALFTGLHPDSSYRLEVSVEGFHKLSGQTVQFFNTDATTKVTNLTCTAGSEDGSVILSFDVEGDEPLEWSVFVYCEGEETRIHSFAAHEVTINELTVGKLYTFQLGASDTTANTSISVSGETSAEYLASRLVLARNIIIRSDNDSELTVSWDAPGDVIVSGWTVRCFNGGGYDQQTHVDGTEATFTRLDPEGGYTIQITADGMSHPAQLDLPSNPVRIQNFTVSDSEPGKLTLKWEHTGTAPDGGWLITYAIDGSTVSIPLASQKTSAATDLRIPGASYRFTLQAADGSVLYNNVHTYKAPDAAPYRANKFSADNAEGWLIKTPGGSSWYYNAETAASVTDQFASGDQISLVLHNAASFYLPGNKVSVLYVIRDSMGHVLPDQVRQEIISWNQIWTKSNVHYGKLDVPSVPTIPGSYTLDVYIDGGQLISLPFSIS